VDGFESTDVYLSQHERAAEKLLMDARRRSWPWMMGVLAALGSACGSPKSDGAGALAALALHGAYTPTAGATSARFSALTFVTATTYSAMLAGCRGRSGTKCRQDGTYVFDGAHDLALTDGATHTTAHVQVTPTAGTSTIARSTSGTQARTSVHLDGLVSGTGGSLVDTSAGAPLVTTITSATFDGAGMQHLDDDDPSPATAGPLVIPITTDAATASVVIQVGKSGTPVPALLDTGSVGIWLAPGILADGDGIDQQEQISQTYGGKQALTAEVKSAYVRLEGPTTYGGVFRTNGPIPVAVVTAASCVGTAKCDDGSANGLTRIKLAGTDYQAVVGIGLGRAAALDGVVTPFAEMGQQSEQFVLHVGPSGTSSATLVIDPSSATIDRFQDTTITLSALGGDPDLGFDSRNIPFCVNQYCTAGVLDSGAANALLIDTGSPSQYEQMGIPAPGTLAATGIVVGASDGSDVDAAVQVTVDGVPAFSFSPGDTIVAGTNEMIVRPNVGHDNLGILPFRTLDVFYDGWKGTAGVTPLAATPISRATPRLLPNQYRGVMMRYGIDANPDDLGDLGDSGGATAGDCSSTSTAGNPLRYSISPDLSGESLSTWIQELEAQGVNLGTLNLDPAGKLQDASAVDAADWNRFLGLMADGTAAASQANLDFVTSIRRQISSYHYTAQERDEAQLNFLQRLEGLYQQGKIDDQMQFIVDQRLWFASVSLAEPNDSCKTACEDGGAKGCQDEPHVTADLPPSQRAQLESQFALDVSGFINQAQARGLDHWLAGVRLEEHANTDMGNVLPIFVDLATLINAQTNGWLGAHTMIGAGGGWGSHFTGVDAVKCPADVGGGSYQFSCDPADDFDFFGLISQQTGAFAFGYKFFEYTHPIVYPQPPFNGIAVAGMNKAIAKYCTLEHICEPKSLTADDWETFLEDDQGGLGLSDLARLVNANAVQYPNHANVVFIGDSQDGIFDLVSLSTNVPCDGANQPACTEAPAATCAKASDSCALEGLSQAFLKGAQGGGGWSGKIYLDGHDSTSNFSSRILNLVQNGVSDMGRFMYQVDYDAITFTPASPPSTLQPLTTQYWSSWPEVP
jgi:hypothetical protein